MSAYYCQSVPNSHCFTNLQQLLPHDKTHLEILTKDHILVGLRNSIEQGFKMKEVAELNTALFKDKFFPTIDSMISFVESKEYSLNEFCGIVENTVNIGFNITNGMTLHKYEVYKRVDGELDYQDDKWGFRNKADGIPDNEKQIAEWINYIEYHLSKAKNAVYHLNKDAALEEIRKVTALGVRTMMVHGCPERKVEVKYVDKEMIMANGVYVPKSCSCDDCDCKKK